MPTEVSPGFELVLTTSQEAKLLGDRALALETLSRDPAIFKGQVLSRLSNGSESLLVGIDPGARSGLAAYYGDEGLAFLTFDSVEELCSEVSDIVGKVGSRGATVRVGSGNPVLAGEIASLLSRVTPGARIEVVDEAGTSIRGRRPGPFKGDQGAAARIAFRKGVTFT